MDGQRSRSRLALVGGVAGALICAVCVQVSLLAMRGRRRRTGCADQLWGCLGEWLTIGAAALVIGTLVLGIVLNLAGVGQPWTATVLTVGTMWPVAVGGLIPRPDLIDPQLSLPVIVGVATAAWAAVFAGPRRKPEPLWPWRARNGRRQA